MSIHAEFPPYEMPDLPPEKVFENIMCLDVAGAMGGSFGKNLWAVGITTDFATLTVDCYMWFDSEPSWLDRDEMAEFVFAFGALQPTDVLLVIHWMTISYEHAELRDRPYRWIYRQRNPDRRLPHDFVESDLVY